MFDRPTLSTHYSQAMNPAYMRNWAEIEGTELITYMDSLPYKDRYYPVLFYRGMSGVSHASWLSAFLLGKLEHGQLYIRKKKEVSNGVDVEQSLSIHSHTNIVLVFVDDFICSGDTLMTCLKKIKFHCDFIKQDKIYLALEKRMNYTIKNKITSLEELTKLCKPEQQVSNKGLPNAFK